MLIPAACLATLQHLSAGITVFDISPDLVYSVGGASFVTTSNQVRSIDFSTDSYSTTASGNGFTIRMTNSPAGSIPGPTGPMFVPGSYEVYLQPAVDTEIMTAPSVWNIANRYVAGTSIGPDSLTALNYTDYGSTTATWVGSTNYSYVVKSGNFATGGWSTTNGTDYIGVRIKSGASDYNYGWLEVQHATSFPPYTYTFKRFAMEETVNVPIVAGSITSVPEPSTALLGALGAIACLRRRR